MLGNENKVCKLIKYLYGLKQAPKQWHQKFDEVVLSNGYLLNQADKYVYRKFDETGKGVIIFLYVDDMLIFSTDQIQVDMTKEFLPLRFSMKDMGEANVILGIKIKYESNGIAISQSHYIEKVLKKFNYSECTLVSTPMDTSEKLMPNNGQVVSQLEYSRMIGCLMYAMTCTRPDIAFAVGKLTRLTYTSYPSVLEGYTNASWISNTEDNSSTSGWVFLLGGGVISWASKKQTCITGSTMKFEFVALAGAGKEAEWLKNLLLEIPLWSKPITPISIRCDSAATLAKAYSQMYNEKSRHLGVRHSMICELITNGVVSIEFLRRVDKKDRQDPRFKEKVDGSMPVPIPAHQCLIEQTLNHGKHGIRLYCLGKDNGENIMKSITAGPFQMGTMRDTLTKGGEGALHLGPERARIQKQHEVHANENRIMMERFGQPNNDPLALVSDASVQQYPTQSSKSPQSSTEPYPSDNFQMNSGSSSTENLIESLSNSLALLTQSYKSHLPQTNNQLRASSNARNQAMVQDGKVVVQDVRGRYNANTQGRPFQRNNTRGNGVAGNVGGSKAECPKAKADFKFQKYFKDKMLLMQAQESGAVLDEEQSLFLAGERVTNVDDNVDDSPENDLVTPTLPTNSMWTMSLKLMNVMHSTLMLTRHKYSLVLTVDHYKSKTEEVTLLKKDFKQKEDKFLEEFLDIKKLKDKIEDRLYKQDQSVQTVHMLCQPKSFYDEKHKVAIGYKNPLCLTRAKQVQPALYNGHVLVMSNHARPVVHDSEDTREISEITRKRMLEKMKSPLYDNNRKKAETLAPKPISALTVYPPNTPVKLVPRILPTKSQVKINLYVLTQLFTEFDKTCKTRITPSGLTEGERGFEQTKRCYLTEVIPFFKTLKEHFVGVQTALFKEVKVMEEIFDQMNNEVDKNTVDKQCAEIEKKNLLIENENLIVNCLSTQLLYDVEKSRCLDLEADMSEVHDESKLISKLERECLNLQLKYQHLQESFDNKNSQTSQEAPDFNSFFKIKNLEHQIKEKDNVIRHLKDLVASVNDRSREPHNDVDVTALIEQNDCDRVELEKVKQHYKELYDSIKINRAHTSEKTSTMLNEIESLKAQLRSKEHCLTSDYVKPKVLAPGMYAIDVQPIPHPLKNNR
ncbi:zinc finger, CCHC-type containing protein, partial [Tanacetum coccineum]